MRLSDFAVAFQLAAGSRPKTAPRALSVACSPTHPGIIPHSYGVSAPHGQTCPPFTRADIDQLHDYRTQHAFTNFNLPVPPSRTDYPLTQCCEYMSLPQVFERAMETYGAVQVMTVTINRQNTAKKPLCDNCRAYVQAMCNKQPGLVVKAGGERDVVPYMSEVTVR